MCDENFWPASILNIYIHMKSNCVSILDKINVSILCKYTIE